MRQAMRLDQRAWVAPQSLVIHPKSGEPIFAQAVIANSGKTFAFKVSTDFSLKFSHERLDIEKYVQSPARQAPKTIPSLGILAPNVPYTLNVTLDEIPPTIRTGPTFLDQWEFVYFFGLVSYKDFAICGRRLVSRN